MIKNKYIRVLIAAAMLLLPACQGGPAPAAAPTVTFTPLPSPSPTAAATATPSPVPPATLTPTHAPSPPATAAPTTAAPPADCIASELIPVDFLPGGERLLVRGETGVQVVNLQTRQVESSFENPAKGGMIPPVALSPDGEVFAWALPDNTIQVVGIADKKILRTLKGHTDLVGKLRYSPTGDRVYSASHDTWVRAWDRDGKQVLAFQPTGGGDFPNEVLGIGIAPDGATLATIPFDGPVKLWSAKDGSLVRELGGTGGYDTSDIAFAPDGQRLAADLATGLFLWNTADGKQLLGGNPGINSMVMAFSPDGRSLAYAEIGDKNPIILAAPDGSARIRVLEGQPGPVWELVFSPDGARLVSTDGNELRVWDVASGQVLLVGKKDCPAR